MMVKAVQPQLPISISKIQDSYLLFDVDAIAWLRENGQICGAFIGTLHQNPSQNVFLGLPLEIVPEEANHLVEKGLGFILDDVVAHEELARKASKHGRDLYLALLDEQAHQHSRTKAEERETSQRKNQKASKRKNKAPLPSSVEDDADVADDDNDVTIFGTKKMDGDASRTPDASLAEPTSVQTEYTITPTITSPLLYSDNISHISSTTSILGLDSARKALTSHFHNSDAPKYFLHPGLRFGAHYSVYPGDPLRYHSHFLTRAVEWEEEIDLMDIVSGGRLGTGVKKAFLIGGQQPTSHPQDNPEEPRMRLFSIEWAVM